MINNSSKTERFLKAINSDADARCEKIKNDVDEYIENEIKKTENETKEIEKLVARRSEITEKVFAQAVEKIKAFAKSDSYHDFLMNSVSNIKAAIGDEAVIILRPDDKKLEAEIKALGNEVKYDEFIKLGGCKGENLRTAMTADDTLDARLETEKQNFYSYSGLSLSL